MNLPLSPRRGVTSIDNPVAYRAAARGTLAAEALTQHDRGRLLWTMYGSGMSVAAISRHTLCTPLHRGTNPGPDDGNCSAPEHSAGAGDRQPCGCHIMTATPQEAMNTSNTRDTCDPVVTIEEMGVFESIPALPFLVAAAAHAVYAVLPKPLDRLMCHGLGRVLPADYVYELTSTLQSATGRINRYPHTYCGYYRYLITVVYLPR